MCANATCSFCEVLPECLTFEQPPYVSVQGDHPEHFILFQSMRIQAQAAQEASSQLEAAFSRLTESLAAQRAHLEAFAEEQQVHLLSCSAP